MTVADYYIGLIVFLINFPVLLFIKNKISEVNRKMEEANRLLMRLKLRGRR